MMTCDVPEVFVSIKVILATSNTRRISSDVAFIFPLYLLHRFYSVRVEMSRPTSVFPNRMFQTGPMGNTDGWEKAEPIKNKGSAERSPVKGENPNGPRNTSPIAGPLFGNSMPRNSLSPRNSSTPRNSLSPRKSSTPRHLALKHLVTTEHLSHLAKNLQKGALLLLVKPQGPPAEGVKQHYSHPQNLRTFH